MKLRPIEPNAMPWYYYLLIIAIILAVTYIGLWIAGEVTAPINFLLNLKHRWM